MRANRGRVPLSTTRREAAVGLLFGLKYGARSWSQEVYLCIKTRNGARAPKLSRCNSRKTDNSTEAKGGVWTLDKASVCICSTQCSPVLDRQKVTAQAKREQHSCCSPYVRRDATPPPAENDAYQTHSTEIPRCAPSDTSRTSLRKAYRVKDSSRDKAAPRRTAPNCTPDGTRKFGSRS